VVLKKHFHKCQGEKESSRNYAFALMKGI